MKHVKKFNEEKEEKKYPELRSVRVTYDDGTVIPTSMAHNLSDNEILNYFAIGRTFNIGDGPHDKLAKVKKVEILK